MVLLAGILTLTTTTLSIGGNESILTFSSALSNVIGQRLRIFALVGAMGVGALEGLEVAGARTWLRVHTRQVVLEIRVLVEALQKVAKGSRLAIVPTRTSRTSLDDSQEKWRNCELRRTSTW